MSNNITPIEQLIAAIEELGSISISNGADKVADGERPVALGHSNLHIGVPATATPEQQFALKEQMLRSIQGLEKLHDLSKKYSLLKRNFQSIVECNTQDDFEKTLSTNLLLFLGDTEQFGVLHKEQIVVEQGLSEHTIKVARMQLAKNEDYSVPVATGELYATQYQGFMVIVERAMSLSRTEKNHIKLTLKYICLQHIQNMLNDAMRLLLEEDQHTESTLSHLRGSNMHECLDFLVKDATLDPLTLTYNRRYALRHIENLYSQGTPFAIIMVDIDHFKKVNDLHGHDIGDRVLCRFASLFQNNCREEDIIARWGGEEFLLILESAATSDAINKAERLRQLIERYDFKPCHALTASFGVATSDSCEQNFEALLKQADRALYQAKNGGRNRVGSVAKF